MGLGVFGKRGGLSGGGGGGGHVVLGLDWGQAYSWGALKFCPKSISKNRRGLCGGSWSWLGSEGVRN